MPAAAQLGREALAAARATGRAAAALPSSSRRRTAACSSARESAGEARGRDAPRLGGGHLILHQRDERADHDGEAAEDHRRHLEADRLARPGRQDGERVAAGEDRTATTGAWAGRKSA